MSPQKKSHAALPSIEENATATVRKNAADLRTLVVMQDLRSATSATSVPEDIAAIESALQSDIDVASARMTAAAEVRASPKGERADSIIEARGAEATGVDPAQAPSSDARLVSDTTAAAYVSRLQFVVSCVARDIDAQVIAIENHDVCATAHARNLIAGAGIAIGHESATAYGVLNEGAIAMSANPDALYGVASATGPFGGAVTGSAVAYGYSEIDARGDDPGSRLTTGRGADKVVGVAKAVGGEDVGAYGLVFENANTGGGDDVVSGKATADGKGSTEARSISVGVSDVDDDALSPPQVAAARGMLLTGGGDDTLSAESRLTVSAGAEDQVFFAGANGIVVDGGVEARWIEIVTANAQALAQAAAAQAAGDRFAVTRAIQPLLAQLGTSTLDTGAGDDRLISTVSLAVASVGFEVDPDDDLEVIADAIENGGTLKLGAGDDLIEISTDVRSTIDGAKAFADAHDNGSIGLLSGYSAIATQVLKDLGLIGAGSANPQVQNVEVEVSNSALFDLGDGDDRIVTRTFASAVDDIPSADGLSNRGLWVGGNGGETLDLRNVTVFAVGEVQNGGDDGEQREGIADGWESRNLIYMDDIVVRSDGAIAEGSTAGDGADLVKADATAFGNGVLTISDGFEGREFTSTGAGDDTFDLTARAFTTERAVTDTVGILAQNITAATGLQTEQVDEGDFVMRNGNDRINGRATAAPALGLDPFAFDPDDFAPETFDPASDLFANRSTIAQGISQVTADTLATNNGARDIGIIDTSGTCGADNDALDGSATAFGVADVQSYGILLTNAVTGRGVDTVNGEARATGRNVAFANGVAVGISANADNDGRALRPDQAGSLSTGSGGDLLTAFASSTTFTDGARRVASGVGDGAVVVSEANADANGVLVDLGGVLDLGDGRNRIVAAAEAFDRGVGGINTAVTADGIENRGVMQAGGGGDRLSGEARAESRTGVLLTISGGIDNGFGSTRNAIPTASTIATGGGADTVEGSGTVIAFGGIGLASGIETAGLIDTGRGADEVSGVSVATVTDGITAVADGIENSDIAGLGGGVIATGGGRDTLFARATATGVNSGAEAIAIRNDFVDLVNDGHDTVTARGRIDLGTGDDVIDAFAEATSSAAVATAIGIRGGSVDAGGGDDLIEARSNELLIGDNGVALLGGRGFGGDVEIDMGAGADTLSGFGQASASGGEGVDTLVFDFTFADFDRGGGEITPNDGSTRSVDFRFAGETLSTDGFEFFRFGSDGALAYDDFLIA